MQEIVKNRIKNCVMKRKYHDNQEPQKECNKIRYDKENFESKKVYQGKNPGKKTFLIKLKNFISK